MPDKTLKYRCPDNWTEKLVANLIEQHPNYDIIIKEDGIFLTASLTKED